ATPGPAALLSERGFHRLDARLELSQDLVAIPELGWDHQLERDGLWHGAALAEEVVRARGGERLAREQGGVAVDARPLVGFLDEVILDRVGGGVDQHAHHVLATDEANDAGRTRRPEVFPSSAVCV